MTQHAERVHVRQQDVERLSSLCDALGEQERVTITLANGAKVSGVVIAKPGLQTFLDHSGNEGVNAVLKLDNIGGMGVIRYFWLDDVVDVSHQPSTEAPGR
ncbi:DUF3247 family protein [Luteimonas sp. SDU101]|uniref:DUF3247 family protein n=1 Tax=unclassified Luteimonas TaxID=2629088 RepID=UPI003EBE9A3C